MDVFAILGYVGYVAGAIIILTSKVKTDNLADLKERVNILESERKELRALLLSERETAQSEHLENQKAIAKLEGQVELYRNLQLESIAEHLKKIDTSNEAVLKTLQGSAEVAKIAQADGGLLVKTKDSNPLVVETVPGSPVEVKTKKTKPLHVRKPK